jgi:hypothetical protein
MKTKYLTASNSQSREIEIKKLFNKITIKIGINLNVSTHKTFIKDEKAVHEAEMGI